ncbi:uncharacterized protein SCHCODRAFT_02238535 [Schizophyllum commune H4-8]|uniref:uncharacterized protein n=1 Tax=Schizophyllum commune (strain H4-8 / FGSC 9210) TaxID=578458 RepID=UPI0021609A55|nr:uncharacterized protein SCHCODRAFT_02238535 [Schizophyllum commune H4-8]KAI5895715.1 hypothetical protein SCHCODRAFT_02238535 [Schizophyllum commune H4-8]
MRRNGRCPTSEFSSIDWALFCYGTSSLFEGTGSHSWRISHSQARCVSLAVHQGKGG